VPEADVLDRLGHLYEGTPSIVELALQWRPFTDAESLRQALRNQVDLLTEDEKVALIQAHPDLVGNAALSGTLSPSSSAEQREVGLGIDDLSDEEKSTFSRLNASYQEMFGFPFVICVRENRKKTILEAFAVRLTHDRSTEIETAIEEINKIAWYRIQDVIEP
jgi:OHCU decarboxylase